MAKTRSLERQLLIALCSATLLTAIVAAGASLYINFKRHQEFQDRALRSAAYESVIRRPPPPPKGEQIFLQTPQDPEIIPLQGIEDGYHEFKKGEKHYRAFVHTREDQQRVVALQTVENRNRRAIQSAFASALPLLLLIPILALLSAWILRRAFAGINALAKDLDSRSEGDLQAIATHNLPQEMHSYTRAINRLLKRNAQFLQEQRRFIAAAAHEMRTPLAVLTLQAERLAQQNLPPNAAKELAALQTGIKRNRHLLEQLLSLAHSQDSASEKGQCQVQTVFLAVIEQLLPLAEAKNSDLGISEDSTDFIVPLPEQVLYTLIKNLADNAIRYSPAGSQIDLYASHHAPHILICVEDNGRGMSANQRQSLIAPFARAQENDSEGSGLGLAIVASLAKKYGGTLQLAPAEHFSSGLKASLIFKQNLN